MSYSRSANGFAMAALLAMMTVMAILLSMALPAWKTAAQREKESELIFRGEQYARAIALFQRKYANTFPPNVDILLNEHFLRKKYKDPMTNGDFQIVYANQQAAAQPRAGGPVPTQGQPVQRPTSVVGGNTPPAQGGIVGVVSKSTESSLRVYNGHEKYNEWVFMATQVSNRAGAPTGSQTPTGGINVPGVGGRGGRGGQQPPGGFPPGQGPGGRGPAQGPVAPRGGGAQGTPFGGPNTPGSIFVPAPGRGGR